PPFLTEEHRHRGGAEQMEAHIGSDNGPGLSAPTYGLPHLIDEKEEGKYPLLLVYLAEQTSAEQAYLAVRLQDFLGKENVTLTRWQPSPALLYSQANIHATATLAYRAGWTRFLVADGLTQQPATLSPAGDFCVFAKRTTVDGSSEAEFLQKLRNVQPPKKSAMHNVQRDRYYDPGLTLYEPDRPPFTTDRASYLSHEERFNVAEALLTKYTPLPPELDAIEDYRKIERSGVRSYTITFIPWEYHRARSRREIANLWEAYRLRAGDNSAPFNIYFLQQIPPFYTNPPRWLSAKKGQYTIPVFYLTNSFPTSDKDNIEREIRTIGEGEADGTLDDVWKIFWEVFTYRGERDSQFPIFFIDAQSALDNTVLVVHPDHLWFDQSNHRALAMLQNVLYPSVRGLQYGRVPGREAHTVRANVSTGNMFFEEFTRPQRFPRPDWPCHGFTAAQV
ncbi:hypothetical protein ASPNIDRAFT_40622, partial [Aspergillus niger ATCC 1015]